MKSNCCYFLSSSRKKSPKSLKQLHSNFSRSWNRTRYPICTRHEQVQAPGTVQATAVRMIVWGAMQTRASQTWNVTVAVTGCK
jgi:hypothetical protein